MYRRYVSPKPGTKTRLHVLGDTYLRYMSPPYSAFGFSSSSATRLSAAAALR